MNKTDMLFGTKEWAPNNFNFMNGCSNDCTYCYAKDMAIRFKRKTSDDWKNEVPACMAGKSFGKRSGAIMLPSSHDITPGNIDIAVEVVDRLLGSGNELLIVTKPHIDCIRRLMAVAKTRSEQVKFRFTIGSSSSAVLKLWEPGAPDFNERREAVKEAFEAGFSTSISCEPLLDDKFDELYEKIHMYVTDCIWVGKMNMARKRVMANTAGTFPVDKIVELVKWQSDEKIIALYMKYENNPKIMWKESIKKVLISHGLM